MFCFKTTNLYKETINKSKFVCLAFNISNSEEGKEIIKRLHTEYPDASHICYAYVFGNNQEDFFYSDDGEPNKTAGLPIYNNMKKYKLSFCMIAIVRYFGGIKFGVSALKDCFSNLANKLIELNKLVSVRKVNLFKIEFNYDQIKNNENLFKKEIVKKEFLDKVIFYIAENETNKIILQENNARLVDKNYLLTK